MIQNSAMAEEPSLSMFNGHLAESKAAGRYLSVRDCDLSAIVNSVLSAICIEFRQVA
jgi:hypothetical protein